MKWVGCSWSGIATAGTSLNDSIAIPSQPASLLERDESVGNGQMAQPLRITSTALTGRTPVASIRTAAPSDSFYDTGLRAIGVLDQSIGGIDQDRTFLPERPEYRRPVTGESETNGAGPGLKRALEHIAANSTRKISVQVLAAIAGITPHHFSAVFTSKMGLTPHQFILRTRIERAKAFLPDETHSIREISKLTGFQTQEHFTKVFRKLTGSTPTQFRAQSARR